jgi:hypothetical protein
MAAGYRVAPYADVKAESVRRRMDAAARQPREVPDLIRWFRTEWEAECPPRTHERGVEPESALGAPKLAGAFRSYIMGSPMATDHDDRLDIDMRDAARLRPMHAALAYMSRKWPLSAHYLFAIAWMGAEWQDVALAWRMLPEIGHRFTFDALRHLYHIWERDPARIGRVD